MKHCVNQGSPERQSNGLHRDAWKDLLSWNGSHSHGGQEVPGAAVCELRPGEATASAAGRVQRPESRGQEKVDAPAHVKLGKQRDGGSAAPPGLSPPCDIQRVSEIPTLCLAQLLRRLWGDLLLK